MMRHDLFQRLRLRLLRHGLPPARIRRIVAEMQAHAEDAEQDGLQNGLDPEAAREAALQRLGDETTLAEAICRAKHAGWISAHPSLVFPLLPLLAPVLLMLVPVAIGHWLIPALNHTSLARSTAVAACLAGFAAWKYLWFMLASLGIIGLARRHGVHMKWAAIALAILAVIGYTLSAQLWFNPLAGGHGRLGGGLSVGLMMSAAMPVENLLRFLTPLLCFLAAFGRNVWEGYLRER